jgi:uncharacterized Zn finger protein (UPF0148 family)
MTHQVKHKHCNVCGNVLYSLKEGKAACTGCDYIFDVCVNCQMNDTIKIIDRTNNERDCYECATEAEHRAQDGTGAKYKNIF